MRRREFVGLLGGAAAIGPLGACARRPTRRIGKLMQIDEDDPESHVYVADFEQALAERGWTSDRDVRIDWRWGLDNPDKIKAVIAEIKALSPDVVVTGNARAVMELRQAMPTTPIVFNMISDPVGEGIVQSLAHPGGNVTGFSGLEASIGAKWLELLLEMAPGLARVVYLCNPINPSALLPYAAVEAAARQHAVAVTLAAVQGPTDIEAALTSLAREPGGGLIAPNDGFLMNHRELIIELAVRDRLPAIYGLAWFTARGGLASYGVKPREIDRQAASYVARILRGEKPADLPVQQPARYYLTINLKTAKAVGLDVSPALLARADKVIE